MVKENAERESNLGLDFAQVRIKQFSQVDSKGICANFEVVRVQWSVVKHEIHRFHT